jgi:HEAT repeat protein
MKHLILGFAALALAGCASNGGPTLAHGKPVEHWLQALHEPDAKVRKRAADVLGNVGAVDPAVVPALAVAVQDRDRNVREAAAVALLKMGPAARDATAALSTASRDSDPRVRTVAVRALEGLKASNHSP